MPVTGSLEALADVLIGARRIVVFTGAGISTESGIADFRSPGGIWSRISPIAFDRFKRDPEARLEDWRRRFHFQSQYEAAVPNDGHRVTAELIARDGDHLVVTQNIDGLHQRAGVSEERIAELHGTGLRAGCLECRAPMTLGDARRSIERTGSPPVCFRCGGIVKADVVSFGQPMPQDRLRQAAEACAACDVCLVLGSSLAVRPAASLPQIAAQRGAHLAIVDRADTPLDSIADTRVFGPIGHTMREIERMMATRGR